MKHTEFKPDSRFDLRRAESTMPPNMPPDCFGKFDEAEAILRDPLADIDPDTHLGSRLRWYQSEVQRTTEDAIASGQTQESFLFITLKNQAEKRLQDFTDLHREFRLHRWNGESIEQSLWYARDAVCANRKSFTKNNHVQDMIDDHLEWAISTDASSASSE